MGGGNHREGDPRQMAEANAAIARRIIHDLEALLETLHADVVWNNRDATPPDHHGEFRGKAEVGRIIREWVTSWEDYRISVEEVIEVGEHVILVVTESGVGKASGAPIENRHCYLWRFRDGLIVSGSGGHKSKAAALEAVREPR